MAGQVRDFSTLLIANRGEIAVRIMRTANSMGLRTVAVYSEADRFSAVVENADQAICIGPAPVADSYLNIERIIQAAKQSGADAIHPGYGFLSENAAFAQACEAAGLVFVGPSSEAIALMGDKAKAKQLMLKAGVPCVPGYQGSNQQFEQLQQEAERIGLPLMIKAVAGGGGRGMRLLHSLEGLDESLRQARSEAENAFGNGDLILERAISGARHVEIQIFADSQGHVVHLGERDCSVQRRYQKVIEEAPCPVMTPHLRQEMGQAAIAAAQAVAYRGAGTVEFLLDAQGSFYFLEMNTRLQVEHPVTEQITGLDLVRWQLQIASGMPLPMAQEQVSLAGHAIEVRLCAEAPESGFLPSTGRVELWQPPEAEGIRVDSFLRTGDELSPFYDSMVAKIIATGADRNEARRKLVNALHNTALLGPDSNRDFLIALLESEGFASGQFNTDLISELYGDAGYQVSEPSMAELATAATLLLAVRRGRAYSRSVGVDVGLLDWSSNRQLQSVVQLAHSADPQGSITIAVRSLALNAYEVSCNDERFAISLKNLTRSQAEVSLDGRVVKAFFSSPSERSLHIALGCRTFRIVDLSGGSGRGIESEGDNLVVAPMHGSLMQILVSEGDEIRKGDKIAVLEAMKMQHELTAQIDGTVVSIVAQEGAQLGAGELILQLEPLLDDSAAS
ncbi:MAG: acetyl/propionyl/methylcrotonyl-CoA carboxylase subunit alpha [Gammaproteobacteria bacterium]